MLFCIALANECVSLCSVLLNREIHQLDKPVIWSMPTNCKIQLNLNQVAGYIINCSTVQKKYWYSKKGGDCLVVKHNSEKSRCKSSLQQKYISSKDSLLWLCLDLLPFLWLQAMICIYDSCYIRLYFCIHKFYPKQSWDIICQLVKKFAYYFMIYTRKQTISLQALAAWKKDKLFGLFVSSVE